MQTIQPTKTPLRRFGEGLVHYTKAFWRALGWGLLGGWWALTLSGLFSIVTGLVLAITSTYPLVSPVELLFGLVNLAILVFITERKTRRFRGLLTPREQRVAAAEQRASDWRAVGAAVERLRALLLADERIWPEIRGQSVEADPRRAVPIKAGVFLPLGERSLRFEASPAEAWVFVPADEAQAIQLVGAPALPFRNS